jgi:hypothetical protein
MKDRYEIPTNLYPFSRATSWNFLYRADSRHIGAGYTERLRKPVDVYFVTGRNVGALYPWSDKVAVHEDGTLTGWN